MAKIRVSQADIDNCEPSSHDKNCVALALKRLRRRDDIRAFPFLGQVRIGRRVRDIDDWAANRLVLHMHGYKIEPFEFDLGG